MIRPLILLAVVVGLAFCVAELTSMYLSTTIAGHCTKCGGVLVFRQGTVYTDCLKCGYVAGIQM